MRSTDVDYESFTILSDGGQMIGGVMVFGGKRIDVNAVGFYSGSDILPTVTPETQVFAETEARRLGMLGE